MTFLTDFADQAVVIPVVLAVSVMLLIQGWRRGALAWLLAIGLTLFVTLLLKMTFLTCWQSFGTRHLQTPSGHVAAATVLAGGIATLCRCGRDAVLAIALFAAGLIGLSRYVLGYHSLAEVLLGALIGLGGTMMLYYLAGRSPRLHRRPMMAVIIMIAIIFHGWHVPAEAHIRSTALRMAHRLAICGH